MTPPPVDPDVVDGYTLTPLYDELVTPAAPPGSAVTRVPSEQHAEGPDSLAFVRAGLSDTLSGTISAGLNLLRSTAGLGFRLAGLGRFPLALTTGPIGRAIPQQQSKDERPTLAVRALGDDVQLSVDDIAWAYPHATDKIALFLPGSDEECWKKGYAESGGTYGSRLASYLDWTPVYFRNDETSPVAESGVALSAMVQELVETWPHDVRRIAVIGHANGGLVARAAVAVKTFAEQPWTDLVTDVVALGTPHLVAAGQPMSTGLARQLDEQLAGILTGASEIADLTPLEHARYVVVSDKRTTIRNPFGRVLGDLLWWRNTATFSPRRARDLFPTAVKHEVLTDQAPLSNHPVVLQELLGRLA